MYPCTFFLPEFLCLIQKLSRNSNFFEVSREALFTGIKVVTRSKSLTRKFISFSFSLIFKEGIVGETCCFELKKRVSAKSCLLQFVIISDLKYCAFCFA